MRGLLQARIQFGRFQSLVESNAFREMEMKSSAACMIKIRSYLNVLSSILNGTGGLIASVILGAVSVLINYVCQAVVTEINSLLAMACIPIPKLGLNLTLPQLQAQSCDGISLQNVISVQGFSNGIPGYGSVPGLSLDGAIRQMLPSPGARPLSTLLGTAKP